MKNMGIIIQARLNSKRFPNKILKKINKKNTVIDFLINRLKTKFNKRKIIIAYPIKEKGIPQLLNKHQIQFFSGSEKNVLKRYYDTAKKFNLDIIVRITSDCPLVDPKLIKRMLNYFNEKKIDYLSNTLPPNISNWPDGSDIEIFNFKTLNRLTKLGRKQEDKEHVTNFIWKNPKKFKIKNFKLKNNLSNYKYSIDYSDDLDNVKDIIKILISRKEYGTTSQICKIIKSKNKIYEKMLRTKNKFDFNRMYLY